MFHCFRKETYYHKCKYNAQYVNAFNCIMLLVMMMVSLGYIGAEVGQPSHDIWIRGGIGSSELACVLAKVACLIQTISHVLKLFGC